MEDPRALFGARVRQVRKARGLSQESLAYEAGLDRTYVGGVERGERNVSLLNICKLAKALGVPPKYLVDFGARNPAIAQRGEGIGIPPHGRR